MTDPIETYDERLLQVKRRFELYPDRIVVRARWLWRGTFETTVRLSTLDPRYRSFFIRNKLFKPSMLVLGAGLIIALLSGNLDDLRTLSPLPVTGMAIALVGLALSWLTSRRIRFVHFPSREKGAGVDVGCAGREKANFDAFVSQVQRRIGKCAGGGAAR